MERLEHSLWVEKYRPTTLDTYIGNEHLKSKVSVYLESGDLPHLLLYGKAGTGKTTLAKLLVNNIECDYLYINASDENNVETVRTKVKNFASTIGFKDMKVIILDECDYITPNAQAALRNLMETFSKHCRFVLTCNYVERIIDPIQSRCQSFQIIPPSKSDVAKHLHNILIQENVIDNMKDIKDAIRTVPNFPKEGIQFRDITSLLEDTEAFNKALIEMTAHCMMFQATKIVGIESRGVWIQF